MVKKLNDYGNLINMGVLISFLGIVGCGAPKEKCIDMTVDDYINGANHPYVSVTGRPLYVDRECGLLDCMLTLELEGDSTQLTIRGYASLGDFSPEHMKRIEHSVNEVIYRDTSRVTVDANNIDGFHPRRVYIGGKQIN